MKEVLGVYSGYGLRRLAPRSISVEDGIYRVEKSPVDCSYGERLAVKRELGRRLADNSEFFIGVDGEYMARLIMQIDGKTEAEAREIVRVLVKRREIQRTKEAEDQEKWRALREKFGGAVIGLDRDIDVYDAGFSVRVLFKSDMSFADRKRFLMERRREFVAWVMAEVGTVGKFKRQIGDVRFYRPVEMINLRSSEVEVKFEVKKEVVA